MCLFYEKFVNKIKDGLLIQTSSGSNLRAKFKNTRTTLLTLVMMGGLQTLVLMGLKVLPPFFFVKTIEKVIRLCSALKKKILDWQFYR